MKKSELDKLVDNHMNNMGLPVTTNAAFISRRHLENYLQGLPGDCDAIKVCYVRFDGTTSDPARIAVVGNNLTQLSLVFVGMTKTDIKNWNSTEITDAAGNLKTLCVCDPAVDDQDQTGLCPPKVCK
jgi:hypothetical protein